MSHSKTSHSNAVRFPASAAVPVGATCDCADARYALSLSDISCEGCQAEMADDWAEDFDFVHLVIDGRIAVNGRVAWREGRRAAIRFFGQIHPLVVSELAGETKRRAA